MSWLALRKGSEWERVETWNEEIGIMITAAGRVVSSIFIHSASIAFLPRHPCLLIALLGLENLLWGRVYVGRTVGFCSAQILPTFSNFPRPADDDPYTRATWCKRGRAAFILRRSHKHDGDWDNKSLSRWMDLRETVKSVHMFFISQRFAIPVSRVNIIDSSHFSWLTWW